MTARPPSFGRTAWSSRFLAHPQRCPAGELANKLALTDLVSRRSRTGAARRRTSYAFARRRHRARAPCGVFAPSPARGTPFRWRHRSPRDVASGYDYHRVDPNTAGPGASSCCPRGQVDEPAAAREDVRRRVCRLRTDSVDDDRVRRMGTLYRVPPAAERAVIRWRPEYGGVLDLFRRSSTSSRRDNRARYLSHMGGRLATFQQPPATGSRAHRRAHARPELAWPAIASGESTLVLAPTAPARLRGVPLLHRQSSTRSRWLPLVFSRRSRLSLGRRANLRGRWSSSAHVA